ncbi:MAG: MIT C-terminal domain-containing protein [Chloroflexales bacterium]
MLGERGKRATAKSERDVPVISAPITPPPPAPVAILPPPPREPELKEQHYTIFYGATGYSYEAIFSPYFTGATTVVVEDSYIRMTHQIQNLVRFCEVVLASSAIRKITLITGYDDEAQRAEAQSKLADLQQSLLEQDIVLEITFSATLHDREICLDNGWVIKIGRGLDFYQKPDSWFSIGANDLALRTCLETKVDIYPMMKV